MLKRALLPLLLGAVLAWHWLEHDALKECHNPLEQTDPQCYFSPNWFAARNLFLHHAKRAGAELVALEIGPDLVIDVAVFEPSSPEAAQNEKMIKPKDDGVLIHISGTHGVEGFAGSAVQSALLHEIALGRRKVNKTVVFVHGLNPFGMQHFRRFNENNVDLNRNVVHPPNYDALKQRDPNVAGYEDFYHIFNPKRALGLQDKLQSLQDVIQMAWKQGAKPFAGHLKRALVSGTYTHPEGLFFGGHELQPSHAALINFLVERGYTKRRNVVLVDVHTGLGPYAKDTLIVSHQYEAVRKIYGRNAYKIEYQGEKLGEGGNEASAGYDLVNTCVQAAYGALFEHAPIISLTQEFGTVPGPMAAYALIKENQGWFHDKQGREDGRALKEAFGPTKQSFAERVLVRGIEVFDQSMTV